MHISTISRLYNRPADAYNGLIRKAIDDEDLVVRVYEPLRFAVVAETRKPGSGGKVLLEMLPRLDTMKNVEVLKRNNLGAFQRYRESFLQRWPAFFESYLDSRKQLPPVSIAGLPFSGRFHFSVRTTDGVLEYVHVSASECTLDMLTALRELLAIIGCDRHKCERKQVVLLDLNKGAIHLPSRNFIQTRRKLESILRIGNLIEKEYRRS